MTSCPRCEGQLIIDAFFLEETKQAMADLLVQIIVFAKENKLDHTKMPILTEVARTIRIVESL